MLTIKDYLKKPTPCPYCECTVIDTKGTRITNTETKTTLLDVECYDCGEKWTEELINNGEEG